MSFHRWAFYWLVLIALVDKQGLLAQSQTIDRFTVNGGGTSAGGLYSVSGTLGQLDASNGLRGGDYSLTGGFWSLLAVLQTPSAPKLYLSHNGITVTVCWQDVAGWSLQQNNDLTRSNNWTVSSGVLTDNGTNSFSVTPLTGGNLFFRLTQP